MKEHLKTIESVFMIVILITLLVCSGLYAAEETLPIPEEIIAKNIEARGGIKAFKKIQNKKIVRGYKFVTLGINGKTISYQERPDKFFSIVEETGGEDKNKSGSDGKISWGVSPLSGIRILKGDALERALLGRRFDGPDGPDVSYKSMKTEGIEWINGKACYKVIKTPAKGTERTVYYDKNSFMIVKITAYNIAESGVSYKRETYYEEYQKIDNILFPYKTSVFANGQKFAEYTFDEIELNIEMPEGIFDIPEEVKAIMDKK